MLSSSPFVRILFIYISDKIPIETGMGEGNHPNHSWVVTESDEKLYGKASGHGAPADALLSKSSTKDFILGISSEQSGWFVSDVYMRQFTLEEDLCETAREFGADELILSSRIGTEAYIDAKLVEGKVFSHSVIFNSL